METVCSICTEVRNKTKHGSSFQELVKVIRRTFKSHDVEIHLRTRTRKFLGSEEFFVNAYYDPEDDQNCSVPIEVIIFHNFKKDHIWDTQHITDLLIEIFDAVVHEFKHQRQSYRRHHVNYWEHVDHEECFDEYLADPDEIDAYAFSIAIELCRSLGKFRALKYLPRYSTLARMKIKGRYASPNLSAYVGQFQNVNDALLEQLIKKIYVRLQKLDTDHIFV